VSSRALPTPSPMSTTEDRSGGASGRTVQQAPGLWRTDLQQQDFSVPGREVVQSPAVHPTCIIHWAMAVTYGPDRSPIESSDETREPSFRR
jgi:hypothetical protein